MPTNDENNGSVNIREILAQLRQKEPVICSAIENYIAKQTDELQSEKRRSAAAETQLAEMEKIYDLCGQCAVLLTPLSDAGGQLLKWTIVKDTPASAAMLETSHCIGRTLADLVTATSVENVPDIIDESYSQTFEANTICGDKYLVVSAKGQADGSVLCGIADGTETIQLRTHLQRFDLIEDAISTVYSNHDYNDVFDHILNSIGSQFLPKRILVFVDDADSTIARLQHQWAAPNAAQLPTDLSISYTDCPSWHTMLKENSIIEAVQLSQLPPDVAQTVIRLGLHNACIFPVKQVDIDRICGAVAIIAKDGAYFDKSEIKYLGFLATIISGHVTRKIITDALIFEKERAEEADRLKSSFLVNVSHDIRIPMNAIIGFSDLLADEDLTQTEREEFIDMINKSGQDLVTLIDNIIDISKIETGQMTIKKEEIPIFPLLNDIMAVFNSDRTLEERDDLSLQLDLPSKYTDIKFSTDIFKFRQVCINLIDNAIKFTNNGYIKFGVSRAWDQTIEFYVQDTGIGIPEDQQHIIFQRFGKVDQTFANEYTGTGLGLPICKSIIEMLGGEIRVVSKLGKGSTFYFTHPLPCKVPDIQFNMRDAKSSYDWSGRRILIVDAADNDRKFLVHVLNGLGADMVWANANEAVRFFEDKKLADLVLVEMTAGNRLALEKIIKLAEIPVVAQSTTEKSDDDRQTALVAGCAEYLAKPLNANKLLATIDALIRKNSANTN